ncbi:hypothetical protein KAI87_05570, partial [Myxococcota bacterium]|nr:hypothetical protein [Myxococcota bacterium]
MAKPIFIYDDPQKSLSALSEYLRANGYDPIDVAAEQITADSDIAAQFKGHQPELIFVSLLLPESIEITNQIRNVPEGTVTPIIFIGTGNESVSSPSEALYHGGDYFFALPLDLPTVLARVQVYIGTGLSGNLPELPPISPSTELPPPPAELPPAPDPAPAPIAPIHHPAQARQPNSPQLPQFNWKNKEQGIQTGEQNLTDAADDILALISAREDKNKEQEQQKEAEEEKKRQDEAEAEARKLAEEAMAQETLAKEKEKLAAERKLAEAERTRLEVEALSQRIAQEKEEKVEQEERARRDAEELARQ